MRHLNKKTKRGRLANWAILGVVALFLSIAPISMLVEAGDSTPILVRTANLVSPTGSVNPHGMAEYQLYQDGNRELEVEAEDVALPDGTVLTAFIDGSSVGQMTLSLQKGRLKLRTEDGQSVPVVNDGSTVQVRSGTTVLVAGVFGGGGPTPTPTVTASPTASPSASPTASPSPTVSPSPTASPSPGNEFSLFAALNGATINGVLPRGFAEFEVHSSRTELEVRLSQINLPAGTSLTVAVAGNAVGQIVVSGGEGRLRLRSDNGQTVPNVVAGTAIAIRNGSTTILSGTFAGTSGSPTPSPSPSGSPTPQQGRFFEAHLSGAQMTPPVGTSGRGELKIFLNAAETQANASGEYNLTSAQTSAKVFCEAGSTTALLYDFGALGGTERHYTASFAVTAAQLQMLRTGTCYQIVGSVNFPNGEIRGVLRNDGGNDDFDGDGGGDFAVFRPSTGTWYMENSIGITSQTLGGADDKIVSGDFDGDGRSDAAVYRNAGGAGVWEIRRSADGGTTTAQFGLASDVPVRGDFDGDKRSDLAVFRPSNGTWYVQKSDNSGYIIVQFGQNGDRPMASDMDGDGRSDIVIFRPSLGDWYWLRSSDGQFRGIHFGVTGDVPVRADFDGDSIDDVAVYRPSNGAWYWFRSSDGAFDARYFGISTDVPVPADFDKDGKTDVAVFRASTGAWYFLRSSDGAFDVRYFGANGDIPTPAQ